MVYRQFPDKLTSCATGARRTVPGAGATTPSFFDATVFSAGRTGRFCIDDELAMELVLLLVARSRGLQC